jgi:hypothetical protein
MHRRRRWPTASIYSPPVRVSCTNPLSPSLSVSVAAAKEARPSRPCAHKQRQARQGAAHARHRRREARQIRGTEGDRPWRWRVTFALRRRLAGLLRPLFARLQTNSTLGKRRQTADRKLTAGGARCASRRQLDASDVRRSASRRLLFTATLAVCRFFGAAVALLLPQRQRSSSEGRNRRAGIGHDLHRVRRETCSDRLGLNGVPFAASSVRACRGLFVHRCFLAVCCFCSAVLFVSALRLIRLRHPRELCSRSHPRRLVAPLIRPLDSLLHCCPP